MYILYTIELVSGIISIDYFLGKATNRFSRLQIGFSESVAGNIGKEKIKLMIMKD